MGLLPDIILVLLEEGQRKVLRCHHQLVSVLELILNFFHLRLVLCIFWPQFVPQNGIIISTIPSLGFQVPKLIRPSSALVGSSALLPTFVVAHLLVPLLRNVSA